MLVEDARRFILHNRAGIEEAPLQTYASALVSSPSESLIRKCYLDQLPTWLTTVPAVERKWSAWYQTLKTFLVPMVAFSPDGKYLASTSDPFLGGPVDIQIWEAATGGLHSTIVGQSRRHRHLYAALTFLPNGSLAVLFNAGELWVWEPITGAGRWITDFKVGTIVHSSDRKRSVLSVTSMDDLAVLCGDAVIRLWSWETGASSEISIPGHAKVDSSECLSQERLVLSAVRDDDSNTSDLILFDCRSRVIQTVTTFNTWTLPNTVSSNDIIAWSFDDGQIWLFDSITDTLRELGVHMGGVSTLALCPGGRNLVSSGHNGTLILWNVAGKSQTLLGTCLDLCRSIAVSPNGKQLATTSIRTEVQLWDLASTKAQTDLRAVGSRIQELLFSPCGSVLAAFSTRGDASEVEIYDPTKHQPILTLLGCPRSLSLSMFSPDSQSFAAIGYSEAVRLWDLQTGRSASFLSSEEGCASTLAFSSDGNRIALGDATGNIRVWDLKAGTMLYELKHSHRVLAMIFSSDGERLASIAATSSDEPNDVALWNTTSKQQLYHAKQSSRGTPRNMTHHELAISPNNRYLVCPSGNDTLTIHDTQNQQQNWLPCCLCPWNRNVAFRRDSKVVAFMSGFDPEPELELWDIEIVQRVQTLPIHIRCHKLSFSADGDYLETDNDQVSIFYAEKTPRDDSKTTLSRWRYSLGWIWEGSRKMMKISQGFDPHHVAHHDGLFAFWDRLHGVRYLGFTQGEVVANDIQEK